MTHLHEAVDLAADLAVDVVTADDEEQDDPGRPHVLVRAARGSEMRRWEMEERRAESGARRWEIGNRATVRHAMDGRGCRHANPPPVRGTPPPDGRTGTEERVRVVGTGVSSVVGQSGEKSMASGMFTND